MDTAGSVSKVRWYRRGEKYAVGSFIELRTSIGHKHHVLGGTRLLRTKRGEEYAHAWNKVFITPDQSKEEREKSMKLKRELERRRSDEGNKNLGCFAYKGKKKRARIEDYLPDDKIDGARKRHEGFDRMFEEIDIQIQILQSDLNTKIFEDLVQFATCSHEGFTLGDASTQRPQSSEIPTAALITGVNTPDHSVMFGNLVAILQEQVTPLVAKLRSKDCVNVKGILGKTLSQLLDNPNLEHEEEDALEGVDIKSKNLPLTLSTLAKWYRMKYKAAPSSPKKRKSCDGKGVSRLQYPPVIVVFEDFESFTPKVVQDFVSISSTYLSQIPLVFVFGIATSVSAVHRLLPNEVSSLLCMEKFQAPPSSEYLTSVLNQIIMTPQFHFKLGGRVFQLLLDIFLYHDFSVLNFIRGLRYSMLDHYFSQSVSYLCCPVEEVEQVIKNMNKASVEKVRQLPSFMRYVEGCSVTEQPDLLLNDQFTKDRTLELIKDVHEYHETFFPILKCLHILVSKLPSYPLGKQLREVYSTTLESDMFETESFTQAKELLKMMSKDDLQPLLLQCIESLAGKQWTEVRAELQPLLAKFDKLDEAVDPEEGEEEEEDTPANLPAKISLHQLRQQLQDISKRKKKMSPYEKLRIEVVDYLDSLFRLYLKCPKSLPLHEVFYYDSAISIKRHLNASPRSAIQMALSNPHHYLQCECCKTENNQVMPGMPDICIVYKLHLECGQLINLYDWMQAFITVAQPEEGGDADGKLDTRMQARYIRAVSELQFLGFIKPTKRKTDHIARLTWGGC